jgi:hypothetical protein
MNSKFIAATVIALSSLGATAAFADTFEVITPNTTSTTSRAAVMADLAKARADGSVQVSNETGEFNVASKQTTSTLTRAEVRNEGIVAARAAQSDYDFAGYATY